jgi:hypothetical protein
VVLYGTVPATQPLQVPLLWMVCPAPHAAAHLPVLGPVVMSLALLIQKPQVELSAASGMA